MSRSVHSIKICMKVISMRRSSLKSGNAASSLPSIRLLMMNSSRTDMLRITTSTLLRMRMTISRDESRDQMMLSSGVHLAHNLISRMMRVKVNTRMETARVRTPTGSTTLSSITLSSWPFSRVLTSDAG